MTRKRGWTLLLCFLTGCSTHPLVDVCDFFKPGKLYPNTVTPYGGVAIPQGAIIPAAPNISVGPPAVLVPGPPGPPVVPPPASLPGNRPPGFQLQTPTPGGDFPPPPPNPPGKN
jgi:hypothetical protein